MTNPERSLAKTIGRRSMTALITVVCLALIVVASAAVIPILAVTAGALIALFIALMLVIVRAEVRSSRKETRRLLQMQRQLAQRIAQIESIRVQDSRASMNERVYQERLAAEARTTAQFQRLFELLSESPAHTHNMTNRSLTSTEEL